MKTLSSVVGLRGSLWLFFLWLGLAGPLQAQTSEGLVPDSTELRVLRQFYHTMGGPKWTTQTNWLQGTTLAEAATWHGVTVAGGDVVALALPNNNFQPWPYPPYLLYLLRGLQRVDLSYNRLDVYVLYSLRGLPQLQELNLSGSRSNIWIDFDPLSECPNLRVVRIRNANVSGRITAPIGRMQRLEVLDLGNDPTSTYQKLSGVLPPEIGNCRALRQLRLQVTAVGGVLPASLGRLQQLQVLDLSYCLLDGPLPDSLGACKALRVLQLQGQGWGISGDLRSLRPLTNLQRVDLSSNTLWGSIPTELGNNANLVELRLGRNHLTGAVPASLAALRHLKMLHLHGNTFTHLPAPLASAQGLQLLVHTNQLDFGSLEPHFTGPDQYPFDFAFYSPQAAPPGTDTVRYPVGQALTLQRPVGGQHTHYVWQRYEAATGWQDIVGAPDAATWTRPAATVADSGLYRVRATNDWVTDLTVYSKVVLARPATCPPATLTLSPSVAIPAGDAVVLRAYPSQAGAALHWSPATGLSATAGGTVTAAPTTTTTYTVTAMMGTAPCASSAQATVTVTVTPPPTLTNPPVDGCAPALAGVAPAEHLGPDPVNYVRTYTARVALTEPSQLTGGSKEQVQVKTEYLDGLGRPVQTVLRQESPEGRDLVQPLAYDALGRPAKEYLPYAAGNTGEYRPNALLEQYDFYRATPIGPGFATDNVARTGVAYAEKQFEPSPLNRVVAQGAPGESWQLTSGHAVGRVERPNTSQDAVPRFEPGYGDTPAAAYALPYRGDYPAGELWLTEATDEHGFRTQEYKDKQGQVVAKRVECPPADQTTPGQASPTWLSTYYAYDDFGRLRAVVPPKAAAEMAGNGWQVTAAAEALLFRYRYDGRGRVMAKLVPGTDGETRLVYDQLDRPVLSQDAAQRQRDEWSFSKYDALGRPVLTGLVTRAADQATLQAEADATTAQWEERTAPAGPEAVPYTTAQAYPRLGQQGFSAGQVLTVTHYDDYNFDNDAGHTADARYDAQYDGQFTVAPQPDPRVTSLPTRTRTRVLGVPATDPGAWLTVTTFYDEKARPIQVRSTNARGGEDVVTTQLDFQGKVVKSYSVHTGPNLPAPLAVAESFAYDHAGRLTEARQQLPGEAQPTVVAQPRYNELGQLVRKTLAPGSALQQRVDYAYNIRGWLTHLNDARLTDPTDLWGFQLHYDCGFQVPQFNGNIAGQTWRSRHDNVERAYGYLYGGANRLLQGDFVARNAATQAWTAERQRYGLAGVRYDENGNILALQRRGLVAQATRRTPAQFGSVDQLGYTYQGNRLMAVDDQVTGNELPRPAGYAGAPTSLAGDFQEQGVRQAEEYRYDANGNLTQDRNKGITGISYNHLNLPEKISFSATDYIEFRYAASGQKVAKRVYQSGKPVEQTDYLGAYQYESDSLRFFPHAEGRVLRFVSPVSGQVRYEREYTLKDHLGNLRIAYRKGTPATYWASMEPNRAQTEQQQFDSVSIASTRFAGTPTAGGSYVARLNASGPQPTPLGPLKMLPVQKGDTVRVTAPGLYKEPVRNRTHTFSLLGFVATLLQHQPAPPAGGDAGRRVRPLPFLGLGLALVPSLTQHQRVPKGYVRYLMFNKDSVLIGHQTQQLSEAALNSYEPLQLQVVAPEDGYVQVYVGNESDTDVFFDDVTVEHRPTLQVQENHYDPWGLSLAGLDKTGGLLANQYQYNGKEKQAELGLNWNDYGARMYNPQIGRMPTIDRFAEKYYHLSAYSYAGNNSVNLIDINGDSLWVAFRGTNILYQNGNLFNDDGSAYTGSGVKKDGSLKGFLKQTVNALNKLGGTTEGSSLLKELQGSNNSFIIEESTTNSFDVNPSQRSAAYANQLQSDPQHAIQLANTPATALVGGGGGTIKWNPNGADVWVVGGGLDNNPTSNLAHELFHGRDANRGLMDDRLDQNLKRDEWQVVFKENQVRTNMGLPLREYYKSQSNNGVTSPLAPKMLDSQNRSVRPNWVPSNY